ncbi:FAD binding domain-containing protein [Apiospora marii]|uniref:FAD binding domain-containing protein n=1 Tax=Apiospora marii TaxID=335849 RepID=UPI00312D3045
MLSPYLLVWGLILLRAFVAASPVALNTPYYFQRDAVTRAELPLATIQQELGSLLSPESVVIFLSDARWNEVTRRWRTTAPPDVQVVVQPGSEDDVPEIVKYCNKNSLAFLAVNRGHGFTTSLGNFKGVQIDLKQLTGITTMSDRKPAMLQGGTYVSNIVDALWEKGYVTSTGSVDCIGAVGTALGGGHSRYEGIHGLIADQVIQFNVVLADGSTIEVNETSHEDLFWAMKGAGHNFGIVTSMRFKIYPAEAKTWHYHNYVWRQDKMESVFRALNKINDDGATPPELVNAGSIAFNQSVSTTEATISWQFSYAGSAQDAEKLLEPFNAIEAVYQEQGDVPYPEISRIGDPDATTCNSDNFELSTVLTQMWNITTQHQLLDNFLQNAARYPELGQNARLFYEGYPVQAVTTVDPASTAYPHRDEYHLAIFMTTVPEGREDLSPAAAQWARDVWDLFQAGRPPMRKPAVYVNYVAGHDFETLESVYGHEPWRLARLRDLKAKYDPQNRFYYFVPIIPES